MRILILKFGQDIDLLQNEQGRGDDYYHFNRPFENLFKGFDIGNIGNPFSSFKV